MKKIIDYLNEGKYKSLADGVWKKLAEKFVNDLSLADDTEIVVESVHQLLDYIYDASSQFDKKHIVEGVKLFMDEYGK